MKAKSFTNGFNSSSSMEELSCPFVLAQLIVNQTNAFKNIDAVN